MVRQEWKRLFHNKILLVVVLAVIAIPTIYTTLFLGSMWDPYGNVDRLPVAVVNEDRGAEYGETTLQIGQEMVKELKEDGSLDFHFVDASAAEKGLQDGSYYMVVTIPENFSACAATLTEEKPQKMELLYETNPGTNYIASKLSETAMKEMESTLREEVTETYVRAFFEQMQQAGKGIRQAADGAGQLENGTEQLAEGNRKISDNLKLLAESSLVFREGSTELAEGIEAYTDGVGRAADGAAQLDDGAGQLQAGVSRLSESAPALSEGVDTLENGAAELENGIAAARNGSSGVADGAREVDAQMENLSQGLGQLQEAASALPDSASELDQGAAALQEGSSALIQGMEQLSAGGSALQEGAAALSQGLRAVAGENNSQSQALADGAARLDGAIAAVSAELTQAEQAARAAAGPDADPSAFEEMEALLAQLSALEEQAGQLSDSVSAYTGGVNAAAEGSESLSGQIPQLQEGIAQAAEGARQLDSGLGRLKEGTAMLNAEAPALSAGLTQAADGAENLRQQGTAALNQGAAQLENGMEQLAGGSGRLTGGLQELNGRLPALNEGVTQLQNGTDALKSGTEELRSGTSELAANSSALMEGTESLTEGAGQISDGAGKLYQGSRELGDGISQAEEGSETLKNSLSDGAAELESVPASEETTEMFAAPVETRETRLTSVPDNGHGMAPYMMSVGLWVGCIAFSLMYPLTRYYGKLRSGAAWWLSKASVLYLIAILQALVMVGALHLLNGFTPVRMGETLLLACTASLAFMSVMYFFTNLMGKAGSFLMLIFMVIQLAGSAGTYPPEISGSFVPYLHGWVPFTYTVTGFRSTISGGESIAGSLIFLLILFLVFSLLTLLEFEVRARKIWRGGRITADWLEEHGLG
jgi:putative membrane protein